MPYLSIADFRYGLDRRRPRVAGVPGTLWSFENAHITRGGDIERAKKFVKVASLPTQSFGLTQQAGLLRIFGSAAVGDLAPTLPANIAYTQLSAPSGADMTRIYDVRLTGGSPYVIAGFADGTVHHFFGQNLVTDWDTIASASTDIAATGALLASLVDQDPAVSAVASFNNIVVSAVTPGVPFTLTASTNITPVVTAQANVVGVTEARATGSVTITGGAYSPGVAVVSQIAVGATHLLAAAVDWTLSNEQTAALLAAAINEQSATSGYTASSVDAVVTIEAAAGTGATPNGSAVAATVAGGVSTTSTNMAGGVTAVAAQAQIVFAPIDGAIVAADSYTITVNGTAYTIEGSTAQVGLSAFVYKTRVYSPAGSLFRYSRVNTPTDWSNTDVSSGAGLIDMSADSEDSSPLVAAAQYLNLVAIFSRQSIRLYDLETDSTLNAYQQTLSDTGTLAPRSVRSFGNTDVFYLDATGIRSVRARNLTNTASVSDIGSAIDPFVRDWRNTLDEGLVARAVSGIEPLDGRFWLAIGGRIFVLSYFESSKISGWSHYDPGFVPSELVRLGESFYIRSTDNDLYLYGGADGQTYPDEGEQVTTIETPFMSAQTPATFKKWTGIDFAAGGSWEVYLLTDPNNPDAEINLGTITNTTTSLPDIGAIGESPLFAFRLVCSSAGPATISSIMMHYEADKEAG